MSVQATVFVENTVFSQLGATAEHGWSILLETDDGTYLFDTGQGNVLVNNARVFNKDLAQLDGILLSHHHIDHTGGLLEALKASGNRDVDVFAHPDLFKKSYLTRKNYKPIGVPFSKATLEEHGANFIYNRAFTEVASNLFLTGEIPRMTDFEYGDADIVEKTEAGYVKDEIMDDQSVVVKTKDGLFIILGCCHAGIINTLQHAIRKTGEERIHTVIGGTHLWPVSEEQKEKSIEALKQFDIQRLGVSHCTGFEVGARLAKEFGETFFYCNVGTVVEM